MMILATRSYSTPRWMVVVCWILVLMGGTAWATAIIRQRDDEQDQSQS